ETICQVHGIRRTNDHQADESQKREKRQGPEMRRIHQGMKDQIRVQAFEERNHQLRGVSVMRDENEQRNSHNQADEYLKIDFLFCGEPEVSLLRNFRVVVNE